MALTALTLVGEFVLYIGLGYFFLVVVLAVSGETVQAWPLRRRNTTRVKDDSPASQDVGSVPALKEDPDKGKLPSPKARSRRTTSESHLEFLDRLRTNLKYQGSTIALIIFAVLLLGLQHVLDGPEIGTLLAGITGYVLGTSRGGSDTQLGHSAVTDTHIPDAAASETTGHAGPAGVAEATVPPPKEHPRALEKDPGA
jgi:hypothetical protein